MMWEGLTAPRTTDIPFALQQYIHMDITSTPYNIIYPLTWDFKKYPHALLIGGTGTGKTTTLKGITSMIAYRIQDCEIFLLTFKHRDDDFPTLREGKHFASYARFGELFEEFYHRFLARLEGRDPTRNLLLLVADEWAGFLLSLDKKEQERILAMMGQILMMGRSMNVQAIVALQRPDAIFFRYGARDNFGLIVALGNLSSDGNRMVFSTDYSEMIQPCIEIGDGHALIGGSEFYQIKIPWFSDRADSILRNKLGD